MYSKYHIINILEMFFSKYQLLFSFLDQASSNSHQSQILILQFPKLRACPPFSPFLLSFILANWNPLQHNPHHVLHWLPYFVLPHLTTSHHKYWKYQITCKAKSTKFIYKLYTVHDTLWIQRATHQKAELFIQHGQ